MQIPLQISFENAEPSEAVRAAIGHEVERLEKYQHRITGCRVAVVAPSTKHLDSGGGWCAELLPIPGTVEQWR